jgi:hypothetical protein
MRDQLSSLRVRLDYKLGFCAVLFFSPGQTGKQVGITFKKNSKQGQFSSGAPCWYCARMDMPRS